MSVKSTVFGSIRLTGRDSEKFVNQVAHGRPKQAAKDAYAEGKTLAKQMRSKGYAEIKKNGDSIFFSCRRWRSWRNALSTI